MDRNALAIPKRVDEVGVSSQGQGPPHRAFIPPDPFPSHPSTLSAISSSTPCSSQETEHVKPKAPKAKLHLLLPKQCLKAGLLRIHRLWPPCMAQRHKSRRKAMNTKVIHWDMVLHSATTRRRGRNREALIGIGETWVGFEGV
ncbi:hypothetical protein MUK42_36119 [Musa troglodytarum]|uniref:Uncharacterized protein n=1 Tax=Musa troglodytarum TaxID=320322 RepID=A0A9E7KTW5_9LILI|nr:hypothetical protein MUK42_36119 [Musa troglodytarum]